jgi:hypothetical protein
MEYKNQHFVTQSYLKAWCDPSTPNGAFVWIVSKKDRKISRKSPKSLFSEDDFYTYYDSENNRSLELEHKLKEIEDKFIQLRDEKIKQHIQLNESDRLTIALFASTTFARTKRWKEDGQKIWKDYVKMVDNLPKNVAKKVKELQAYKDVINIHKKQPMIYHLFNFVNLAAPFLYEMNCAIYETKQEPGFITSDNPCFWFDPAIYDPYKPLTYFGIGSPTLNVLLPITPNYFLSLAMKGGDGYVDLYKHPKSEIKFIDSLNYFTASNSEDYIVVNRKTLKDRWFDDASKL